MLLLFNTSNHSVDLRLNGDKMAIRKHAVHLGNHIGQVYNELNKPAVILSLESILSCLALDSVLRECAVRCLLRIVHVTIYVHCVVCATKSYRGLV